MPDRAGVRVATWNLQWKGPRSPAASAIDQRLRRFEAQVAVLTEVRWPMLKLWRYQELAGGDRYPGTPEDGVKVAIASDLPMARKPLPVSDELLVRNTVVVDVDLGEGVTPLRVIGIVVRWNAIAAYLERLRAVLPELVVPDRTVVAGDFNLTVPGGRRSGELLEVLGASGLTVRTGDEHGALRGERRLRDHLAVSREIGVAGREFWPRCDPGYRDGAAEITDHAAAAVTLEI